MKIVCEIVGGPMDGLYGGDKWPLGSGFPIRAWSAATELFTIGRTFETHCIVSIAAMRGQKQARIPGKHLYEVVAHVIETSDVHVRIEYRGLTPDQPDC